jgi:hypothetical protein
VPRGRSPDLRRSVSDGSSPVWWFGNNNDLLGQTPRTDPMFQLHAHLTRDFTVHRGSGLDLSWYKGGGSTIDGVPRAKLDNLGVGPTPGRTVNQHLNFTFGCQSTVDDSAPTDLRMDGFMGTILCGRHPVIEGKRRLKSGQRRAAHPSPGVSQGYDSVDLILPITIVDELSDGELRATGMLNLASGDIHGVRHEDYDTAKLGFPADREDYEFTSGMLSNGRKEVEFRIEVDALSGRYSVTPSELLELKGRAARLFTAPPPKPPIKPPAKPPTGG